MAQKEGSLRTHFGVKIVWTCDLSLQANLGGLNGKQVEEDYKLVENEGLFQEYLEMGNLDWTGLVKVLM